MDFLPKRIVDAGYISWLYGVYPEARAAWGLKRLEFRGDLMVLDSPISYRVQYWMGYKANRREDVKPEQQEKVRAVREFRNRIGSDWLLNTILEEGLEADDIVSVLTVYSIAPAVQIIGVDKDYLQLPPYRLKMETLNGEVANIGKFRKTLPKKVQLTIKAPIDVLFTLALLGDKADNIPRIVPPYHLDEFLTVMEPEDPAARIDRAIEFYGQDFIRNIYLAVLPGPWVYDPIPGEMEVLERIAKGNYYSQKLARKIKMNVLGAYYCKYPLQAKKLKKN